MQMATRESSAVSRRWPWTLEKYFEYWSVATWYGRIRSGDAWQPPHRPTVSARLGTPRYPLACAIPTVISSDRGSPPWQSAQPTPSFAWMLAVQSSAIASSFLSTFAWQSTQPVELASPGWSIGGGTGGADTSGISGVGVACGTFSAHEISAGSCAGAPADAAAATTRTSIPARTTGPANRASLCVRIPGLPPTQDRQVSESAQEHERAGERDGPAPRPDLLVPVEQRQEDDDPDEDHRADDADITGNGFQQFVD